MKRTFTVEALTSGHVRSAFRSGVPALDRYLVELVTQDIKRRVSNCFVALDDAGAIVGYYTLAATNVPSTELHGDERKRLPRYPLIPAALIGRLAIDRSAQGQGLGSALVMDAVTRSNRSDPAIFAVIVDAKDETAVRFYRHLGSCPFGERADSLYLPIATALKALAR